MEYIGTVNALDMVMLPCLILMTIIGGTGWYALRTFDDEYRSDAQETTAIFAAAGAVLGTAVLICIGLVAVFLDYVTYTDVYKERIALFDKEYGIALTKSQYESLGYPMRLPDDGQHAYGTTNILVESDVGLVSTNVQLAWDGHQLILISSDGPLPSK